MLYLCSKSKNELKLSVVIVNYNVKYFLEQCLSSVFISAKYCETEVFVVDNNSVDGSCAMIRQKFPDVKLIENKQNYGFSFANNQAIRQASGEYVLLLNPDTLVEEKTFQKVCDFMDNHADCGSLGVKMIDGKGRFCPESKRGLPTPKVAFYKIFGLAKIFPKSKKFGQYHLSFLDKDQTHQVDILSGAFMLLRKTVLDKVGLLDETFFMYGEDIDLSYRITLAGYKNYYFPETTIIHYKGESTKKSSINYVLVFYKAMSVFAKKHFSDKNSISFSALINIAIYLRAFISIIFRFFNKIIKPLIDFIVIAGSFGLITFLWSHFVIGINYDIKLIIPLILIYTLIWIITLFCFKCYSEPLKIRNLLKGIGIGAALVLIVYSLFPEDYRFSRMIILFGTIWNLFFVPLVRFFLHLTKFEIFRILISKSKNIAIVGDKDDCLNLEKLLNSNNNNKIRIVFVNPNTEDSAFHTGNIEQLEEIVRINKIDEIIFCINCLQSQQIIASMQKLQNLNVDYKIAGTDGFSIVGNNSINRLKILKSDKKQ